MSKLLKSLREQQHLSQEEVAVELCVDRSTISRLETGKTNISTDMLFKLSNFYKISISDILAEYQKFDIDDCNLESKKLLSESAFIEEYRKLDLNKKLAMQYVLVSLLKSIH